MDIHNTSKEKGFRTISKSDSLTVNSEHFLLEGSNKVILQDTFHGGIFGEYWYGSESKVNDWWSKINF